MKLRILPIALLIGSCAVPPSPPVQHGPLAELAGRSPGPAQHCVIIDQTSALRVSDNDRHTVLYGSGKTIWANHLGQCAFNYQDALVTEPLGSYHCRGDLVRSFDRSSHIPGPACVLGDFVPYSR